MVSLERRPVHPHFRGDGRVHWRSCLPFIENSKAHLVHRPRSVTTFTHSKRPYISVSAWCGNSFNGSNKFTFLKAPMPGQLVCQRCEDKAVLGGEMPSDLISGTHVHKGRLVPKQTCCIDAARGAVKESLPVSEQDHHVPEWLRREVERGNRAGGVG